MSDPTETAISQAAETPSEPQLLERVIRVVASIQKIAPERIAADTTFAELGMDSLDGVNLVFAIEEEFDLSIPDDAAKSIRGVREMADGVAQLLQQKTVPKI